MRIVYYFVGIVIITLFVFHWLVITKIDLFQYRAVRLGYAEFYHLMDGLFNEFRNEDDDQDDYHFDSFVDSNDDVEDAHIEKLSCYTWSSLNELIAVNHERVMNSSKRVINSPKKIHDRLVKEMQIMNRIIQSWNIRLNLAIEHLPSFLNSYQNQLDNMLATVNDINQGFQNFIGDAITKIDHDQFETHKTSSIRIAKILQQFEMIIQSRNEAQLECACDVAKNLDDIVQDFTAKVNLCANNTGEQFSDYFKDTITSMANSLETAIRSVNRAMKRSKTSVEVFYQLPIKVCVPINITYHAFFHKFNLALLQIYS